MNHLCLIYVGVLMLARDLFDEALNYYKKAIDLNPHILRFIIIWGLVYNDWKKPI